MTSTTSHLLPTGQDVESAIAEGAHAYELDRKHVFHSWSAQAQIKPMTIIAADGQYVWDGDGNKLLDFSGQLVFTNIGHQHPKVVAAIAEQA
ncbi:MAG: aminotransferase class III-fold pyridoxal phosphate-dependent enzyme, partial [Mycobacterium sp.]